MTPTEALRLAWDYHSSGDLAQALALYQQIVQADPRNADALHLMGAALMGLNRMSEAVEVLRQAVAIRPNFADAHNHLGIALGMTGQLEEAVASFRAALGGEEREGDADVYNNLGSALIGLRRPEEAAANLRQAVRRRPDFVEARNSLGVALADQQQLDEAIIHLRRAIELRPDFADAHGNLAGCLTELGRLDEALAECEQALQLEPNHVAAHRLRSRLWLTQGDYERGWAEYEWRLHGPGAQDLAPTPSPYPLPQLGGEGRVRGQPLWDGSDLAGRTILLRAEQGLGDLLQFVRYAPLVKRRGGRVLFECPAALAGLLSRCAGIDEIVTAPSPLPSGGEGRVTAPSPLRSGGEGRVRGAELPSFDVYAPLLSLPHILRTRVDSIPAEVPYLFAEAALVTDWRRELRSVAGFKVGIAWQGNPQHRGDKRRSIPLRLFAPLAAVPGVRLLSLQKSAGREQLEEVRPQWPITELGDRFSETATFDDTAAIMMNLDLVIGADTAVAHLAGGLGLPVWVALPFAGDFRWLAGREDSPWYPSMSLFRQPEPGTWAPVFVRMADELRKKVARKRGPV